MIRTHVSAGFRRVSVALALMLAVGSGILAGSSPADAARTGKKPRPAVAATPVDPTTTSRYASIVMDAETGQVLHARDADARKYPASLTKMMTLYLAFEALERGRFSLDHTLPVSSWAEVQSPTKLGLRAGQSIRVEDAVLGLVTKSANDAAVVLAEGLAGSVPAFAARMTDKAHHLGMNNTQFRNASGLPDEEQYTTARDMAILGRALVRDFPRYYPYFSRPGYTFRGAWHRNHNRLMERYPGMDGIKTGFINASGFNLVASAVRGNRRLIAAVFGGISPTWRDNHLAGLLDQSFSRLGIAPPEGAVAAERPQKRPEPADDADTDTRAVLRTMASAGSRPAPVARPDAKRPGAAKTPEPPPTPAKAREPAKAPAAPAVWGIQVGAYADRQAGQKALADASRRLSGQLGTRVKGDVVAINTGKTIIYRAQFVGLPEKGARQACDQLQKQGQKCTAVAPAKA